MTDPYRDETVRPLETLLAEERVLLVRAGRVMVVAGGLGVFAALAAAAMVLRLSVPWYGWIAEVALPLLFSTLTLEAGLVLSRLPGDSRGYGAIARAVSRLGVVYAIKGVIVIVFVSLMAIAFFLPMLLHVVR